MSFASGYETRRRTCATPRRLLGAMLVLVLATACSGSPFRFPTRPEVQPPLARTPEEALRLLEWSWEQRDSARYAELIADDFGFVFSVLDRYGYEYRENPWTRDDDVISAGNLFHGGDANQPAAVSISFRLDRNLVIDSIPGQNPRWHRSVRSSLSLVLADVNQTQTSVSAHGVFHLVRGDHAAIPEELMQRGVGPDSTRWYLQRWEDVPEVPGNGTRAMPAKNATIGMVKALYR
jgi:hypothetical protein